MGKMKVLWEELLNLREVARLLSDDALQLMLDADADPYRGAVIQAEIQRREKENARVEGHA